MSNFLSIFLVRGGWSSQPTSLALPTPLTTGVHNLRGCFAENGISLIFDLYQSKITELFPNVLIGSWVHRGLVNCFIGDFSYKCRQISCFESVCHQSAFPVNKKRVLFLLQSPRGPRMAEPQFRPPATRKTKPLPPGNLIVFKFKIKSLERPFWHRVWWVESGFFYWQNTVVSESRGFESILVLFLFFGYFSSSVSIHNWVVYVFQESWLIQTVATEPKIVGFYILK